MNRLFTRYPWLCFLLAIVVIANNYLKFAPGQASEGPMSWVVPGILIFLGCMGYLARKFMPGGF
ncbi:MAG: hypothetical protein LUG98_05920 [Tannerellaceae bacterium]|nr:hypothetical protein [Tannerellaceae bacterium]